MEQNRIAALQMVHVDKAMKAKECVTKQRIELLEHLNRAHQRFIYKNVLPGAGLAAQKRSQGQRYLKAARTYERRRPPPRPPGPAAAKRCSTLPR